MGTRFCPGTQGGVNWYGPAYSPAQNALYVNSIDWCTTIKLGGPETLKHEPGKPFLGSENGFGDSKQYVAVAAGMKGDILKTESGPANVVIYALPSQTAANEPTRTAR